MLARSLSTHHRPDPFVALIIAAIVFINIPPHYYGVGPASETRPEVRVRNRLPLRRTDAHRRMHPKRAELRDAYRLEPWESRREACNARLPDQLFLVQLDLPADMCMNVLK